jgi:NAD(P)-dependent dehydrogenase (short-subunit alcohol dehydrogenase family)
MREGEMSVRERAGRVEGKVAIVTGAGSTPGPGIGTGKAISIALAREGAKIFLVDLFPERAEETKRIIEDEGGEAVVFRADCTKWRDCAELALAALDRFGTIDILVNNLGLAAFGSVTDLTERDWDRTFDINLRTVFLVSKYTIPVMAAQRSGSVINLSSISAQRSGGRTAAYSASKGAVEALTVDMAGAHGPQGIRVNCILPGNIVTPVATNIMSALPDGAELELLRQRASMLGVPGNAWDIAWAVVFLASEEARWISGVTLPVDAGSLGLTPLSKLTDIREIIEASRDGK